MTIKNASRDFAILRPKTAALIMGLSVLLVDLGYVVTQLVQKYIQPAKSFGLYEFFHLGQEANLPTFIAVLLLLTSATLLSVIYSNVARTGEGRKWPWLLLAIGFFVMCADEASQIHEGVLGLISREFIGAGEGIWFFGWYIPFIPLVAILAVVFIPFLRSLPRMYAVLFVTAGALFISGAIGVEMVQSYISFHRIEGGAMFLSVLVEESLEMIGIVIFNYALLRYMAEFSIDINIRIRSEAQSHI